MTFSEWEVLSRAFVALAFGTILRSLIVGAICGCGVWLLRSKNAELRWTLWRWALLALIALPFLMRLAPPMVRPLQRVSTLEAAVLPAISPAVAPAEPMPQSGALSLKRNERNSPSWVTIAPVLYLLVAALLLVRFALSLLQLQRIAQNSELIRDAHFLELAHELWLKSEAFLRPRIVVSKRVSAPVSFNADGVWILLPEDWPTWGEAKLRAVLAHEMAHVRRDDSAHLQFASLVTCLFWFHPLSWFLRRQLAALAEEVCDEAVVGSEASPEQYANFLIDFARDVRQTRGRLVAGATAFVRSSSLERRIRRIFAHSETGQHTKTLVYCVAFLLFLPSLYLIAAPELGQPPQDDQVFYKGKIIWPNSVAVLSLSPEEVAEKASAVRANPEDLNTRMELLLYYGYNNQPLYADHLLWLIGHHPDLETLPMTNPNFGYLARHNPALAELIQSAWQQAMEKQPSSTALIFNAAFFLRGFDPERSLELLRKAKEMDDPNHGEKYDQEIATIYTAAEIEAFQPNAHINGVEMTPDFGARLRAQLESSVDPGFLAQVGKLLVEFSIHPASEEQKQRGFQLISQAIQLDPGNPKWTEAFAWAESEPQRMLNYENAARAGVPPPGVVRIGSEIAAANLVSKADPIYPSLAFHARVQGTVEFTVTVGTDGKVERLSVVRGHPLLVNAAKDAVLQWVYHPTTVDGKAIPFQTQVVVPFHLNQ